VDADRCEHFISEAAWVVHPSGAMSLSSSLWRWVFLHRARRDIFLSVCGGYSCPRCSCWVCLRLRGDFHTALNTRAVRKILLAFGSVRQHAEFSSTRPCPGRHPKRTATLRKSEMTDRILPTGQESMHFALSIVLTAGSFGSC